MWRGVLLSSLRGAVGDKLVARPWILESGYGVPHREPEISRSRVSCQISCIYIRSRKAAQVSWFCIRWKKSLRPIHKSSPVFEIHVQVTDLNRSAIRSPSPNNSPNLSIVDTSRSIVFYPFGFHRFSAMSEICLDILNSPYINMYNSVAYYPSLNTFCFRMYFLSLKK